jgi:hypothetical protein
MTGRNGRGSRANMKARIGVATAVLVGGGAVGVAVVAAGHSPASTTASNAAFIDGFHHNISERTALSSALSTWGKSHQASVTTLARMAPMRNFTQVWGGSHHRTEFAAQRGVVVLATKHFIVVKSSNGQLHLWWLTGRTAFDNVTANATGMTAMTGNDTAAVNAVVNQNTVTAQNLMAGSTTAVAQAAAPTKPTTITIVSGNTTITITITTTTATTTTATTSASPTATASTVPTITPTGTTVSATGTPTATPTPTPTVSATATATPTASASATVSATPTMTATQPVTTSTHGIAAGDLVFVTGVREHGKLVAKLVLFSAPTTTTTTPTATPSVSVSTSAKPTATATSTAVPTVAPTGTSASFSGHNS